MVSSACSTLSQDRLAKVCAMSAHKLRSSQGPERFIFWQLPEIVCEVLGCGPPAYAGCPLLQIPGSLLQPADNGASWTYAGDEATRIDQDVSAKLKEAAPDSIAYVMYTSGSTGNPQAVFGTSQGALMSYWHNCRRQLGCVHLGTAFMHA